MRTERLAAARHTAGRAAAALARLVPPYVHAARALWSARLELLPPALLLAAWGLLTWGAAGIVGELAPRFVPPVWRISGGALLLCLFGLGFFRDLAREGLYAPLKAAEAPRRG